MKNDSIRNSGINIIGNINWGTHFCQLYHTEEDLMEIVVPYLKRGLENNEFCIWIASNALEAKETLEKAVPDLSTYLEKKQIEIIQYNDWYFKTGFFSPPEVLKALVRKFNEAMSSSSYEGLRLTEGIFSLEGEYRDEFFEYEKEIDRIIDNHKIISLCTYPLSEYNAADIIDVITNHEFSLIKKEGKWEQIKIFQ